METFFNCIHISLICLAVKKITTYGHILDFVANNKLPQFIVRPIYGCLTCMSSFWTVIYLLIFENKIILFPEKLVAMILITCGINIILDKKIID